jgi:hypothetical protein
MRPVQGRGVAHNTQIRLTELQTIWSPANPSRFNHCELAHHALKTQPVTYADPSLSRPGHFAVKVVELF